MVDEDKVAFDATTHTGLLADLLSSYESQLAGGKSYDLATAGRHLAHATFSDPHTTTTPGAVGYAMDLTPLIRDDSLSVAAYVESRIERMRRETVDRIDGYR
jgi:hypothetical protein